MIGAILRVIGSMVLAYVFTSIGYYLVDEHWKRKMDN